MQVIFEKKLYNSRSDLVRELIMEQKYNKATIAEYAEVAPQTVHYLYTQLVKQGKIRDYYPAFIANRKAARLSRLTNGTRVRR